MFGVGIHFSIRDLLAVRAIAIPGALGQIVVATLLGVVLGVALGWGLGGGLVLGLALSVASTVVLLRALMDRGELRHAAGPHRHRLADRRGPVHGRRPGPAADDRPVPRRDRGRGRHRPAGLSVALALGKAVLFAVLMIVAGARLVPWLLVHVAAGARGSCSRWRSWRSPSGSRTCRRPVFGVSFALGAFLAGAVVGESDMSHQAAADALPLRDAFAVLFFVSVGMLLDPAFLLASRWRSSPC